MSFKATISILCLLAGQSHGFFGFFLRQPGGLMGHRRPHWGYHWWQHMNNNNNSNNEGSQGEQDLDTICANYVVPEAQVWEEAGLLPDKVAQVPEELVTLLFTSGVQVLHEGRLVLTNNSLEPPAFDYPADEDKLYTVVMVDVDIQNAPSGRFIHYMVTNVPGTEVASGDALFEYIPPFTFDYVAERDPQFSRDSGKEHKLVIFVYEQQAEITDQPIETDICPRLLERTQDYDALLAELNLGDPIAANFIRATYSGPSTDAQLCKFTKCLGGNPFPALIPGVNDGPECGVIPPTVWHAEGVVPDKLAVVPPVNLKLKFDSGVTVRSPGAAVNTGDILNNPTFTFEGSDPNKLYTYMIVDVDGSAVSANDFQYMVSNVPGNRLNQGDTVFQYFAPFTFTRTSDDQLDLTSTSTSNFVALVFEQTNGRITVPIEADFCGPQMFDRLVLLSDIVAEYDLGEPVAGTFMQIGYGGQATNDILCTISRCTGTPFPSLIPGVNDMPECQP